MSNSKLATYTKISPNKHVRKNTAYNPTGKILKITPHHAAGNASIEAMGALFADPKRQASANYGVGTDGRIATYIPEDYRAFTSCSPENDFVAVTIEVANDGGAPNWHVSDKAMAALIDLCVDICQRNGIEKLNFTGDKTGNLTMHRYFSNTLCPGPYLASKFPYIEQEVNRRLGAAPAPAPEKPAEVKEYKPSVLEWQKAAMADGFKPPKYFPKYGADGIWGAECEAVARAAVVMQRDTYMYKNLTKLVQRAVGLTGDDVDGLCGPKTAEAIEAYQVRHNLKPVDGKAGIITMKEILL